MNDKILLLVESVSNKKGVEQDVVIKAVEKALATITAKRIAHKALLDQGQDQRHQRYSNQIHSDQNSPDSTKDDIQEGETGPDIRVSIDRNTGSYETFRRWTVLGQEDLEDGVLLYPDRQITLEQAHEIDSELNVGDIVEEKIQSESFGRIGAHQARQIIFQIVRDAERIKVIDHYEKRIGELVAGQVKRVTRSGIVLELGDGIEGCISQEHMISRESVRVGDRLRGYLYGINREKKGSNIFLSRTCPEMLIALFTIEVPEIAEELIEIKVAARDPGSRAKIAVKTNDGRIDPIGACVGMRGARVQAVSNELNGERIDIVLWDDNPVQLAINAMAPAEITSIVVDEESHSMDIAVPKDFLSQAIGRNGQNVRLATQLTGWSLNIMSEEEAVKKNELDVQQSAQRLVEQLDIDSDIAHALIQEGFVRLEDIAEAKPADLIEIDGFDEDIANELCDRAKKKRLAEVILGSEPVQVNKPADDLLALKGMTPQLADQLASVGIVTREQLAEQSLQDLKDLIKDIDDSWAADLIMEARIPWFSKEDNSGE